MIPALTTRNTIRQTPLRHHRQLAAAEPRPAGGRAGGAYRDDGAHHRRKRVGKESFSKIIHALSPRKHGQFIAINCGAIPEGTIDSELFGHEKGSFTGANEARKGYFEVTNGGTIFLDEIGEMPLGTQARLLRVLENGEFIRVGSSKVQKTDVRVVAATNVNLLEPVQTASSAKTCTTASTRCRSRCRPCASAATISTCCSASSLPTSAEKIPRQARHLAARRGAGTHALPLSRQHPPAQEYGRADLGAGNEREIEPASLAATCRRTRAAACPCCWAAARPMAATAGYSERDLLYKVLFDMRRDMTDLKKMVLELATGQRPHEAQELLRQNSHLFSYAAPPAAFEAGQGREYFLPPPPAIQQRARRQLRRRRHRWRIFRTKPRRKRSRSNQGKRDDSQGVEKAQQQAQIRRPRPGHFGAHLVPQTQAI